MKRTEENPFRDTQIRGYNYTKRDSITNSNSTNVSLSYNKIGNNDSVSSIYFVHNVFEKLTHLSPSALRLVVLILSKLRLNDDSFTLDHVDILQNLDISEATFNKILVELYTTKFIAPKVMTNKSRSNYWINYHYIFSGNRNRVILEKYGEKAFDIITPRKLTISNTPSETISNNSEELDDYVVR